MTEKLTNLTAPGMHRLWAELAGDSRLTSLHFRTLGWVPRKPERVVGRQDRFALCVLRPGSTGTFRNEVTGETHAVRGPGVFFVSPGGVQDYGAATKSDRWEEFYWIIDGERVTEWIGARWWDRGAHFWPVTQPMERRAWRLFGASREALENRDTRAVDHAKLALERWLSEGPWADRADPLAAVSPLALVVAAWRRDLGRSWSLPASARQAGLSYTRFRTRFVVEYGESPYAHLLRLRLELAQRWLRFTPEPVKAVAHRCGFKRVESFIRGFARAHGSTPARWRSLATVTAAAAVAEPENALPRSLRRAPRARSTG